MTTRLAIGYLAAAPRNPRRAAPGRGAVPAAVEPLTARPAIPRAVITWTDAEASLPMGAGDPATAIEGPPCFTVIRERVRRFAQTPRLTLDAVLFGALVATLAGLVGAVVLQGGTRNEAWVSRNTAPVERAAVDAGRVELGYITGAALVAARPAGTGTLAN